MRTGALATTTIALVIGAGFIHSAFGQEGRSRVRPLPPMAKNAKTGPAIGARIPSFTAIDTDGKQRTLENLRGPRGLVLLFSRSADWCPYCKTNLADLNTQIEAFRKKGLAVASLTYDSGAILQDFRKRLGITYPMLSDPQSTVIQAFGILNDNVDKASAQYGIPFPGTYIINEQGIVTAKYFEEDYRERYSAASILSHEFGANGIEKTTVETQHLTLTSSTSDQAVAPGWRLTLIIEIDPKKKMHLYAPEVKGYIPIDWQMTDSKTIAVTPAAYPPSHLLNLPVIKETVPVYDKHTRVTRDILIGQENEIAPLIGPDRMLTVEATFKYQACDDKECYLPKTIPLQWTFHVGKLDTQRPPAELQRKLQ
jgi:peroxiredoxin